MKTSTEKCYYAASYSRLSREDGDKSESDSINNQKELIRNFQKSNSDINIVEEYSDDGFSGVDFERPDFKRMMDDIKAKRINCIIVKDLSRFGRNYIETGKYIEQIFPFLEVRFIAINDNYDSAAGQSQSDQIVLPFKNLINDIYCRDISVKVRSNLNDKRKKGDYVGAFAPYGYKKDEENHNQLVIDEVAGQVVRKIFNMKIEGMSNAGIVDKLNAEGILAPYEYKKQTEQGKNYKPSFAVGRNSEWSVKSILRILENDIYLGNLTQGKNVRPNYKVKQQVAVSSDEWIKVENTHEPLISTTDFEVVQKLLLRDTRKAPGKGELYLFSGMLFCPHCGQTLSRRTVSTKKGKYIYYGCYTSRHRVRCKGIAIRESELEKVVLKAIQKQIELILDADELISKLDMIPLQQSEIKAVDEQIEKLEVEAAKYKKLKAGLYEHYHEGIISKDEYIDFKNIYDNEEKEITPIISRLLTKRKSILEGESDFQKCVDLFKKFPNITSLDRRTLILLTSKIYVLSGKKINICFSYQSEFEKMRLLIKDVKEGA